MTKKYTWRVGDDLFSVAEQYGTTSTAILEANPGLRSPIAGIVLTIPGGVVPDPKGPWTADLPTPAPGTTTPPPDPVLPDWFPTIPTVPPLPGVPDPKGPWTADLPTPAPGDTTPPPVSEITAWYRKFQLQKEIEAGMRPPPTPTKIVTSRPVGPPAAQPGYIPPVQKSFPWSEIAKKVLTVGPIEPLGQYYGYERSQRRPTYRGREEQPAPTYYGYEFPQRQPEVTRPITSRAAPPAADPARRPQQVGTPPVPGYTTLQSLRPYAGLPQQYAPPTVGTFGAQGFPNLEGPTPQRSSILEHYLDLGRLPMIIWREDIARMGITEAELIAAGYIQDQFGDWIRGGMTPYEVEQAAAATGSQPTYTPTGRRAAPRGGGGGRTSQQYTGGYNVYPSSRGAPYPQSFVSQQQRGVSPTGRNIRPARFGAVSWRI